MARFHDHQACLLRASRRWHERNRDSHASRHLMADCSLEARQQAGASPSGKRGICTPAQGPRRSVRAGPTFLPRCGQRSNVTRFWPHDLAEPPTLGRPFLGRLSTAVTFGLSMVARHEPLVWAIVVAVARSPDAVAVEQPATEALAVMPELIHQALIRVTD